MEQLTTLEKTDKHGVVIAPVYDFALILHGDPAGVAGALADLVARIDGDLGHPFRWYSTGDMKAKAELDATRLSELMDALRGHDFRKQAVFGFRLHSGGAAKDVRAPGLDLQCDAIGKDKHSIFRVALPLDAMDGDADRICAWFCGLAESLPFAWGIAGYGLFWNVMDTLRARQFQDVYPGWLKRFKGLMHGDVSDLAMASFKGVVDVNWLTFVGAKFAGKLDGAPLASAVADEGELIGLGDAGIAIRAAPAPLLGDTNRRETVVPYEKVASAVAPVAISQRVANNVWVEGLPEDDMGTWLRRLFV